MKSNMCAATICCGGSEGRKYHFLVALKRETGGSQGGQYSNQAQSPRQGFHRQGTPGTTCLQGTASSAPAPILFQAPASFPLQGGQTSKITSFFLSFPAGPSRGLPCGFSSIQRAFVLQLDINCITAMHLYYNFYCSRKFATCQYKNSKFDTA